MSSVGAISGGSTSWATHANQAATQAARHVDRDGDHDGNKPDTATEASKDSAAASKMVNVTA